ncbi:MAG: thiamine pyrophosphate-dependent dehydrogenase E1 component subunit alpha [Actinomycetota bacterium]|nr:thiamine pyrophosphate-dependent dehydrogenase E1 component subunit alpha [Actinomycetota bacterium]
MAELDFDRRTRMLNAMVLIRVFEERMQALFAENQLAGFLHLSIGQEATAVGVCEALETTDYIVTTHRGHGHIIAKGGNVDAMVAELFARETGSCRGVGGSMHLTDPEAGVLCANAIVGASIGLATGAAFSSQFTGSGGVAVAFFGDGAANQGIFHESLNLAALWSLPVVFICENNMYAEMSRQSSQSLVSDIALRSIAYGMPGVTVDGNDVDAVLAVTQSAVSRAREGDGPTLIECKTYRTSGHFEGDQQTYKPAVEVATWSARDPIASFVARYPDLDLARANAVASRRVEGAIEFARESQPATTADLAWLTYADARREGAST